MFPVLPVWLPPPKPEAYVVEENKMKFNCYKIFLALLCSIVAHLSDHVVNQFVPVNFYDLNRHHQNHRASSLETLKIMRRKPIIKMPKIIFVIMPHIHI